MTDDALSLKNPSSFDVSNSEFHKNFWNEAGPFLVDRPFPDDGLLYHYTSAENAINIIEHQELWLSNIGFLNDTNEMLCARNVLSYMRLQDESINSDKDVCNFIDDFKKNTSNHVTQSAFIMSFCQEGDLLGQWRGYGSGVAIAFDAEELDSAFPGSVLRKVIYDVSTQIPILRSFAKNFNSIMNLAQQSTAPQQAIESASLTMQVYFEQMSAKMKNHAFREEKEWRLLLMRRAGYSFSTEPEVFFRMRGKMPVPYVKAKPLSGRLPIKGAILAPNAHPAMIPATNAILMKKGYTNFFVKPSIIPFQD